MLLSHTKQVAAAGQESSRGRAGAGGWPAHSSSPQQLTAISSRAQHPHGVHKQRERT